jgi:hypothetical protein
MTVFLTVFMVLSCVSFIGIVTFIVEFWVEQKDLNGWKVAMVMSLTLCVVCVACLTELSKYEKQLKEVQNVEQND